MTHSRSRIRELLEERNLAPRRARGQNFVADANTVRRIAHLAGVGPGDHVVEIGAGLGSLTLALAETGARLTAVEVDGRWYLSVFFTAAEQARLSADQPPDIPESGIEPSGGEHPEDALDELFDGLENLAVPADEDPAALAGGCPLGVAEDGVENRAMQFTIHNCKLRMPEPL